MTRATQPGAHLKVMAEVASWLMKQPRTVNQLAEVIGTTNKDRARLYLKLFKDEGCIYVCDWVRAHKAGPWACLYAWQPHPFEHDDAPRPTAVTPKRGVPAAKTAIPPIDPLTAALYGRNK